FAEREQAAALAAQREQLLQASRELNDTLDFPDLCARIVRCGRALVPADSVTLTLFDEGTRTLRLVALDGDLPPPAQAYVGVEVTLEASSPFLAELRRRPTAEVPGAGALDDHLLPLLRDEIGLDGRLLFAPVRRDGRFLGYLGFVRVGGQTPFAEHEKN